MLNNLAFLEIIGPALAAGLIISLMHAPLGMEVLKRGIIFIDLSIAQIAGLGALLASLYTENPWLLQLSTLLFALAGGLLFHLLERVFPKRQEALIGCAYVLASTLALLLLSTQAHGSEELQDLLSGQILFVTWQKLLVYAPLYVLVFLLWWCFPRLRSGSGFYLLFAATITPSVHIAGVFVVFASLVMPALAAIAFLPRAPKIALLTTVVTGALATTIGIGISMWRDLPAGPVIVLTYACTALLMGLLARRFISRAKPCATKTCAAS